MNNGRLISIALVETCIVWERERLQSSCRSSSFNSSSCQKGNAINYHRRRRANICSLDILFRVVLDRPSCLWTKKKERRQRRQSLRVCEATIDLHVLKNETNNPRVERECRGENQFVSRISLLIYLTFVDIGSNVAPISQSIPFRINH